MELSLIYRQVTNELNEVRNTLQQTVKELNETKKSLSLEPENLQSFMSKSCDSKNVFEVSATTPLQELYVCVIFINYLTIFLLCISKPIVYFKEVCCIYRLSITNNSSVIINEYYVPLLFSLYIVLILYKLKKLYKFCSKEFTSFVMFNKFP